MSSGFMQPHPPGTIDAEIVLPNMSASLLTWVWDTSIQSGEGIVDSDCLVLKLNSTATSPGVRIEHCGKLSSPQQSGDLSFWPAGTRIRTGGVSGVAHHFRCLFYGDWLRSLPGYWHASLDEAILDVKSNRLRTLMLALSEEIANPGMVTDVMIEGLSLQIAAELSRHLQTTTMTSEQGSQQLTPWQIKRIQRYFESFRGYVPNTSHLAAQCGVSERHFRRLFKATTGKTLGQFSRDNWVECCRKRLDNLDIPISTVAFELGFASSSGLSMAFKRATGLTPAEYRQKGTAAMPVPLFSRKDC